MLTAQEQQRLETARLCKEKIERFLAGEDWAWIKEILNNQILLRRMASFNKTLEKLDDVVSFATMRGEVAGLQFLGAYLEAALVEATMEVKALLETERRGEEEENG